jgi:Holliday junction resolvase
MRRAAHVDEQQAEIVAALRAVGASVVSLASVGKGCPDLLVGYCGRNTLLEVKDPKRRNRLTAAQVDWHRLWKGRVAVVTTVDEAWIAVGFDVGKGTQ